MPSTIEIKDAKRGNIFLNFGDIEKLNPPSNIRKVLVVEDFENSIDLLCESWQLYTMKRLTLPAFPRFWMFQNSIDLRVSLLILTF